MLTTIRSARPYKPHPNDTCAARRHNAEIALCRSQFNTSGVKHKRKHGRQNRTAAR